MLIGRPQFDDWVKAVALVAFAALAATIGCVGNPTTGNDNAPTSNENSPGATTTRIVSPSTSFALSRLARPVSIVYSVAGSPGSIVGYYVPVESGAADANPIGDRVIVESNLPTGSNRQFQFDPAAVNVGFYRVGILVDDQDFSSTAIIQVQGSPNPRFIQPSEDIIVEVGDTVTVSFDAGDPENQVQWRLFYLSPGDDRNASPEQLGTQLLTGSGNVGQFLFTTTSLTAGVFELGLSATDTGASVSTTVAQGDEDQIISIPDEDRGVSGPRIRIVTESTALPPTIVVSSPAGATTLFASEGLAIEFVGAVHEPEAIGAIDVFYDTDRDYNNGFNLIAADLAVSATSFPLPTDLGAGEYFVGAVIRDGINPIVVDYAEGAIQVIRIPTLDVTSPNSSLPLAPSPATGAPITVAVAWTTNVPPGIGRTVEVYAQQVDASGNPFGAEISVLTSRPLTTTTAAFGSQTAGVYAVFVRIRFADGSSAPIIDRAPTHVRVSASPRILWLGELAKPTPQFEGAVFQGVNFEDNAGSAFTPVGDMDGDGFGDFVVVARYGKPFFVNPTGIGPGEAYLIFGKSGTSKLLGQKNLNSVGTARLRGVTFTGIRTPQSSVITDGMSSVSRLPDVDGDDASEIAFGVPHTESRGHNVSPRQNGVVDPRSLNTLEREDQFLRGGVVIVSSRNSAFQNSNDSSDAINLDLVGQDFVSTCVGPEPAGANNPVEASYLADQFFEDIFNPLSLMPPCQGDCIRPQTGGGDDATRSIDYGFVSALSRDYFFTYVYSAFEFGGTLDCGTIQWRLGCTPLTYCVTQESCSPFSPGLHGFIRVEFDDDVDLPVADGLSGYYTTFLAPAVAGGPTTRNVPLEPLGARVIGVGVGDEFGSSVAVGRSAQDTGAIGQLIVSAPGRTARGILLGPLPTGCTDPTACGGEINGLVSSPGSPKVNADSGVAYLFDLRSLWTDDSAGRIPPRPHQYIVGEASHCGGPRATIPNIEAIRIAGFAGDRIENIVGIDDFNNDGLDDFASGAPDASDRRGRVYIAFRRQRSVEGDYVLEKLALSPTSTDRLSGVLITAQNVDGFGSSMATGIDFNADGLSDLIVGSPTAGAGVGEVIIIFGDPNLVSPEGGVTIQTLLTTRNALGRPRAARITGNILDTNGNFGFNIANAGDVDGDGKNDLLIAAPNASPRFDPDPADALDRLTAPGLDSNLDGLKDDVSGPSGIPNGMVDVNDDLPGAGIVYLVSSRNRLDNLTANDVTINISQLGSSSLRGAMIVGRRSNDRLGGGDAGNSALGGSAAKEGRGFSRGLSPAGDVDGDRRSDFLIGSILADPRSDPNTGVGVQNGGEAYLIYGTAIP